MRCVGRVKLSQRCAPHSTRPLPRLHASSIARPAPRLHSVSPSSRCAMPSHRSASTIAHARTAVLRLQVAYTASVKGIRAELEQEMVVLARFFSGRPLQRGRRHTARAAWGGIRGHRAGARRGAVRDCPIGSGRTRALWIPPRSHPHAPLSKELRFWVDLWEDRRKIDGDWSEIVRDFGRLREIQPGPNYILLIAMRGYFITEMYRAPGIVTRRRRG